MRSTISFVALAALLAAPLGRAQTVAKVKTEGYAEYRKGDTLIVDGQRLQVGEKTKFKGKNIRGLDGIRLSYEVKATGVRQRDGSILASEIEAKPNGMALFEEEVLSATNQIEKMWVSEGVMYDATPDGRRQNIGEIVESGPQVERVRRIMARLVPPYIEPDNLRVRVVETKEWNASAMGNGAIWVYSGLLNETSDDEMAIILGHELAHYSHEHSRRAAKKGMWGQIAAAIGVVGSQAIDSDAGRNAAVLGSLLAVTAWQSGYSRDQEDQADRVGLRYAYEGGFDVGKGPRLWERFREKYGESDQVSNFFFGSHSRPSDRIRNLERELRLNYPEAIRNRGAESSISP